MDSDKYIELVEREIDFLQRRNKGLNKVCGSHIEITLPIIKTNKSQLPFKSKSFGSNETI